MLKKKKKMNYYKKIKLTYKYNHTVNILYFKFCNRSSTKAYNKNLVKLNSNIYVK